MSHSDDDESNREAYLDEMARKYIAYTHCTVVEFTQEEGNVGIPQPIASALLDMKNRLPELSDHSIPTTRTVDPAKSGSDSAVEDQPEAMEEDELETQQHTQVQEPEAMQEDEELETQQPQTQNMQDEELETQQPQTQEPEAMQEDEELDSWLGSD